VSNCHHAPKLHVLVTPLPCPLGLKIVSEGVVGIAGEGGTGGYVHGGRDAGLTQEGNVEEEGVPARVRVRVGGFCLCGGMSGWDKAKKMDGVGHPGSFES